MIFRRNHTKIAWTVPVLGGFVKSGYMRLAGCRTWRRRRREFIPSPKSWFRSAVAVHVRRQTYLHLGRAPCGPVDCTRFL